MASTKFAVHVALSGREYRAGASDVAAGNDQIDRTSRSAERALRTVRNAVVGLLAGLSLKQFVRELIDAQLQLDNIMSRLTVATGGLGAARREFGFIAGEAQRLGLNLSTSAAEFGRFAVASKDVGLSRSIFTAVAEASTALGLSAQQNALAMNSLSQMMSKGRVSAEELRQQFGEHIPGAFQLAAQAMGVSQAKLNDMVDSGEVMASDLLPRLARVMHDTFGEQAVARANGMQASINRLRTAWDSWVRGVAGSGANDSIRETVVSLTEWLNTNKQLAAQIGRDFGSALKSAAALLKLVLENLDKLKALVVGLAIGKLTAQILALGVAAGNAGGGLALLGKGLAAVGGPVTLAAAAVGGLVYWLGGKLIKSIDDGTPAVKAYDRVWSDHVETLRKVSDGTRELAEAQATAAAAIRDGLAAEVTAARAELDAMQQDYADKVAKGVGSVPLGAHQLKQLDAAMDAQRQRILNLEKVLSSAAGRAQALKFALAGFDKPKPAAPPVDPEELKKAAKEAEKLADAYRRIVSELDPVVAASYDYADKVATLTELVEKGKLTDQEYMARLDQLGAKFRATVAEINSTTAATERLYRALGAEVPRTIADLVGGGPGYAPGVATPPGLGLTQPTPGWQTRRDVLGLEAAFAEAEARGSTFWARMGTWSDEFARALASEQGQAWLEVGAVVGQVLSGIDEQWAQVAAGMVQGALQIAAAWQAAEQASNAGEAALAGAQMGQGVFGLGQSTGLWQGNRGTGRFGAQLSGDYADVGSVVGGIIGGIIGSILPGIGTAIGALLGSVLGGIIGGAIKKGADEGLAEIRMVAGEASVRITKDEGGLGGALRNIGDTVLEAMHAVEVALGGTLEFMPDIDFKIRDDVVSVFVNGIVRRFKEVDDAINFAIAEALRTAEFSGLSENEQAVLNWARQQGSGNVSVEEIVGGLDLANQIEGLGLGDVGQSLRDLGDWARVTADRAAELGFNLEAMAAIAGEVARGFAEARATLEQQLASLAGGGMSAAAKAVADWSAQVRAALQGAREYNNALRQRNEADARERANIEREIAEQQRLGEAARLRAARMEELGLTFEDLGDGDERLRVSLSDVIATAEGADARIEELRARLEALGATADASEIDVAASITAIIAGSAELFRSFTDQWLAGPVDAFNAQIDQFGEYRDAAADVLAANLEIAESEEDAALAKAVYEQHLREIAEAEEAFRQQTADQTLMDLAGALAEATGNSELLGIAENLRFKLQIANYWAQLEVLRATGRVSDEILGQIEAAIRAVEAAGPQSDKPRGSGGSRKESRKALGDELDDVISGRSNLSGYAADLADINDRAAEWEEEAKKLKMGLDKVREATAALKRQLAADINAELDAILGGRSPVGQGIDAVKKWRDDLLKVAGELGLDVDKIRKATGKKLREILKGVLADVREYTNVDGSMDLAYALRANREQAAELRKGLEELAAEGFRVQDQIDAVTEAERQRAELLRAQANVGFLQGLSQWIDDEELALTLRKAEAALQLQTLRAQLEGLLLAGNLTAEQRAQYEEWLAAADQAMQDWVNTGKRPGEDGGGGGGPVEGPGLKNLPAWDEALGGFKWGQDLARQFDQVRAEGAKLRDELLSMGLTGEALRQRLEELNRAEGERARYLGDMATADLLEQVAEYAGTAEQREAALDAARQLRYTWELAQMRVQLEILQAQNAISRETYDLIDGILDNMPAVAPRPNTGGGGTDDGLTPEQRRQQAAWAARMEAYEAQLERHRRALDLLARYTQEAVDPFTAALRALEADFTEIRAVLGNTAAVQAAYAEALQAIYDQYLDPIRQAQRGLALGAASPFDPSAQFRMLQAEWGDVVAAFRSGDLSVLEQVPGLAQQLLDAAGAVIPQGSQAYRVLYDQIQAFLGEILAMDPNETGSPYGQQAAQPVSLAGPIEVGGINDLRSELRSDNADQLLETQRVATATELAAFHLGRLADGAPLGGGVL